MRQISRFTVVKALFILFGVLLSPIVARAQSKYEPVAVRVGTDLLGIGMSAFGEDRIRYEITGDLEIDKYFLVADFGVDNIRLDNVPVANEVFSYANEGYYFRIGADVNFIPEDENSNAIFFGFRYARSFFSDEMDAQIEDDIYGNVEYGGANNNVRGRWFELNAGMKVNIWKSLYMGYTVRYKFLRNLEGESGVLTPYEMPGYGVYEKKSRIGFNYQIFWRFPLKEKSRELPAF